MGVNTKTHWNCDHCDSTAVTEFEERPDGWLTVLKTLGTHTVRDDYYPQCVQTQLDVTWEYIQ